MLNLYVATESVLVLKHKFIFGYLCIFIVVVINWTPAGPVLIQTRDRQPVDNVKKGTEWVLTNRAHGNKR